MRLRPIVLLAALTLVLGSTFACGQPTAGPGEHCDWDVSIFAKEARSPDGYVCADTSSTCRRISDPDPYGPPYEPAPSPPESGLGDSGNDAGADGGDAS